MDRGWRPEAPPLQGRGLGWGLSVARLAELHGRAAEMRRNPTDPERRLWGILSGRQLDGYKFRRQAVIANYVVDFFCPERKLAVEVDGETHDAARDARRDAELASFGVRVLRVTNRDVTQNIEGVRSVISAALAEAIPERNSPHPNPSPEGEGLS